jgi:hypothetical protein
MLTLADLTTALRFTVWLLLLLLITNEPRVVPLLLEAYESDDDPMVPILENLADSFYKAQNDICATLHHFKFFTSLNP